MKIVSVDQMQTIERAANATGLSYSTMMQNAGQGIARWLVQNIPYQRSVIGLIGSGNNGGDTLIALTWLAKWGVRTIAFLAKPRKHDSLLDEYLAYGGNVIDISGNDDLDIFEAALLPGAIVLDGILGTGFRLPLSGALLKVMENIHKRLVNRSDLLLIAVDCPSGVDCDTGEASDITLHTEHTLTMAAMKKGLLTHPARTFAGELHYIDIGIGDPTLYLNHHLPVMVERTLLQDLFPKRPDSGHKGTFGTCLVIAGSSAYVGAAYLTGKAAYRAGCGLVNMGVMDDVYRALSGQLIEAVWMVLPDIDGAYAPEGLSDVKRALQSADADVIGPGWGLHDVNASFLEAVLQSLRLSVPLVIDADALKLLARIDKWWSLLPDQVVLTPHPGEMSVLTGLEIDEIQANRWSIALEFAKLWQVNLVLKGAMTVVASPKEKIFINPCSDSALGTAGSGDVLTGMIGGLLAQGMPPEQASILGVSIHALAGAIARREQRTDVTVTALDIFDCLPKAIVKIKEAG
ncbi:MAG: NAD(P)H-hydrate dehydratase [Chloroflexi bacterium]|nr:NAD(P)H-hydrate dehydratase [Chloroflexota bacterium]